ncbi:MAG: hypothetical protein HFF10_03520 [Angelakisella sp.]|jgi:hypothetical protein|nr:hypothetical protein [Angelakisella sp.]
MTKSILTLFLTFYSAARLSAIAYQLYYQLDRLPSGVLLITSACCLVCFGAAVAHYRGSLRGKTLKNVLMLVAAAAAANMLIVYLNPVNDLGNIDLLITGTLFDVALYLGVLTLRLPDAPPPPHAPRRKPSVPGDEELDQLIESFQEEQP